MHMKASSTSRMISQSCAAFFTYLFLIANLMAFDAARPTPVAANAAFTAAFAAADLALPAGVVGVVGVVGAGCAADPVIASCTALPALRLALLAALVTPVFAALAAEDTPLLIIFPKVAIGV